MSVLTLMSMLMLTISTLLYEGKTQNSNDPCSSNEVSIVNDPSGRRDPLGDGQPILCDAGLPERWYRIYSPIGDAMPTACVRYRRCGTESPVWLNGSLPDEAMGVVTRVACVTFDDDCCAESKNIQVRRCPGYYLYKLSGVSFCMAAYCFGKQSLDQNGSTNLMQTTTVREETSNNEPHRTGVTSSQQQILWRTTTTEPSISQGKPLPVTVTNTPRTSTKTTTRGTTLLTNPHGLEQHESGRTVRGPDISSRRSSGADISGYVDNPTSNFLTVKIVTGSIVVLVSMVTAGCLLRYYRIRRGKTWDAEGGHGRISTTQMINKAREG